MTKTFPILCEIIGMHCCVAILSILSFVGIIFVVFAMEETKGTNLDAIGSNQKVNEDLTNNNV